MTSANSAVQYRPIKKILIANRGEIARRILHACREMNIVTVAIYSQEDKHALFVEEANEADDGAESDATA